jgi:hypothetical protein
MNRLSWGVFMFLLGSQMFLFPRGQDAPSAAIKEPDGQIFPQAVNTPAKRTKSEGYRSVIRVGDGFLAAGSGGRMDRLSASGEITKTEIFTNEAFNSLCSDEHSVIVAGDKGALWISRDSGKFRKVESGTGNNINSLTVFSGKIIAGADQGEIITGDGRNSFKKIKPGLKGNIVSVSASENGCYGVTDEGEIIHSVNGTDWDVLDFNQFYSGYYKPCRFTRILVTERRLAVSGIRDDGSPVLYFSSKGNVWTDRPLNFKDELGIDCFLEAIPNDLLYDEPADQFILACSQGRLMKLPSCSHCNTLAVLCGENLEGISLIENKLLAVGENFLIKTIEIR